MFVILNRLQQPSHAVREGKPCCNRSPELCSVLLYQSRRVVRAAVHRGTPAQAAAGSPGSHTVPSTAAHDSLSATLQSTPWKKPPPFLWVIQGQWPRNSSLLLKEGEEYWQEKAMTKLLIPMSLGRTFCHSSPETDTPAAMRTEGEATLAVNLLWYEGRYLRYPYQRNGGSTWAGFVWAPWDNHRAIMDIQITAARSIFHADTVTTV